MVPDLICLAKAIGGGLPCGAIGGTEEAMGMVIRGELEQVGTFNGNPLTMAAAKVNLTEVLTKDAYVELERINAILAGCEDVIAAHRLPASMKRLGAKGSIDWRSTPIHEYRDLWEIDDRVPQLGMALAAEPRRLQVARLEMGELDDLDRDERRRRATLRRQLRIVRRRDHGLTGRVDATGARIGTPTTVRRRHPRGCGFLPSVRTRAPASADDPRGSGDRHRRHHGALHRARGKLTSFFGIIFTAFFLSFALEPGGQLVRGAGLAARQRDRPDLPRRLPRRDRAGRARSSRPS